MKFKLVHMYEEFNKTHLEESLVWGSYYEPDDIDTIVKIGFNREDITSELDIVGWSDAYCFPIPHDSEFGSFMQETRKAEFITKNGKALNGYIVNRGHCIHLFGLDKEWTINKRLKISSSELKELKIDLGLKTNDELFPLTVHLPYINYEFIFTLSS